MKNIKETIIGVFAVIGFVVIASGFTTNNATQEPTYGTPESHVWELKATNSGSIAMYAINKVTGQVKYIKSGDSETVKNKE
tara:strand:+ start:614 stop:856 length:243 start_codon:yes stop_codon:yes gene_type:complete